jgi:hypothetical protein
MTGKTFDTDEAETANFGSEEAEEISNNKGKEQKDE